MQSKKMTPEEQADLNERVKSFNAKLIPILGEFKLGLGARAFLTEDGRIAAHPQVFDDSAAFEKKEATPVPDETKPIEEQPAPVPAEPTSEAPSAPTAA
jgi:hypothetical protein